MSEFARRYQHEAWFARASGYLVARNTAIQARLCDTFRFVELCRANGPAYSYEFASILRDAGSVFSSVLHSVVTGMTATSSKKTSFRDYRSLLIELDPKVHRRSIAVRALFPAGLLVPLSALSRADAVPGWWDAYNNVKHSEYENLPDGSLANAVLAVASLVILEHFMGVYSGNDLWVNEGIAYRDDAPDLTDERRLFYDAGRGPDVPPRTEP